MLKPGLVIVLALTLAGHANAQQSANDCGKDVSRAEMMLCLNKLAEGGSIDAMRFLEAFAQLGSRSPDGLMDYYKWVRILTVYGHYKSEAELDKLKDRMRTWQVEEAEGRAARWLKRVKQ